jgi:SlyX protein
MDRMMAEGREADRLQERMTGLEIFSAEQEKTVNELSTQIAAQWKIIERLEKSVEGLTKRLFELEEQNTPEIPVTRPPHW